jgi:hypothetical protein
MQQAVRSRWRLFAGVALAATVVCAAATGLASAAPSGSSSGIAFLSPSPANAASLTSNAVSFKFTYNRKPTATKSLVCTLEGPTASASSSADCDAPVAAGEKGSQSGKSYSGLANGSYTFTVSLTLTDGGTASATRRFSIAVRPASPQRPCSRASPTGQVSRATGCPGRTCPAGRGSASATSRATCTSMCRPAGRGGSARGRTAAESH